jgi:hypothetical protein
LQLQAAGTTIATIQSTGLNLGSNGVVFSDASTQTAAASPYVLKNRIINGDMRIDQRNAGASVATSSSFLVYSVDRWYGLYYQTSKFTMQQNAGSVTPPAGFTNYLGCTSTSAYTVGSGEIFYIRQSVEGFNIADLAWGTANAKTITISFWVRSSLTGTFGGALQNSAADRSYPFSYTISSANTWEQKSVTIAGDTSGTWLTTNGVGVGVQFSLGTGSTNSGTAGSWQAANLSSATGAVSVVGTNGATFYITGVQLEIGTSATPFERRLYNQELANCQRYYEKSYELLTAPGSNTSIGVVHVSAASNGFGDMLTMIKFNVEKRTAPTMTFYREDGTSGSWNMERSGSNTTPSVTSSSVGDNGGRIYCATGANWTVASLKGHWTSSAEL